MRSIPAEDRTARAVIRDTALRLFAERGPDATTIRQIGTAAGVSPGLVIHHFGSKDRLREAVDEHVLDVFGRVLGEITQRGAREPSGSLVQAVLSHLPDDSPVGGYLRTLLLTGSDAALVLFRQLYQLSVAAMAAMTEAGLARPAQDPEIRAAIMLCNDLAVLLLRDQITDATGADPMSGTGMARWASEVLTLYTTGVLTFPGPETSE